MRTITTRPCLFCGQSSNLDMSDEQADAYVSGTLVQDLFPDAVPAQRELIVSGIHPSCWDENFG